MRMRHEAHLKEGMAALRSGYKRPAKLPAASWQNSKRQTTTTSTTGATNGTRNALTGLILIPIFLLLSLLTPNSLQNFNQQQQQQQQLSSSTSFGHQTAAAAATGAPLSSSYNAPPLNIIDDLQRVAIAQQFQLNQALANSVLPPIQVRPNVRVNVREWTKRIGDDIRLVSERTSCTRKIGSFYENEGKFYQLDPIKLRESILNQTNVLLGQHKAAVNGIVLEAEKAALAHQFVKNLTVNYTDVHRVRNELEMNSLNSVYNNNYYYFNNFNLQEYPNDYTTNQYGPSTSSGSGDKPQFTSISGGTPVPGPIEWQTPVKSIAMHINPNFGDIPVNTSMSAVHLPLPVYPGLAEIMNGIAWTERLDAIFRRNLVQYAHVHHQYYGDTLGFMRTFPAHKWRIPRNEPDLFDARTRPWYIAGAATPKDVVILVDTSGSMTGLRREIAKGVVFEILDTLTINDHFAVLRFSETVTPMGLPRCNLKTPRFSVQLREQCRQLHELQRFSSTGSANSLQHQQQQQQYQHQHQHHQQAVECASWRRQWEGRGQYLRDNAWAAQVNNGSYMNDEAYEQSIVNVTLDIRDAYLLPATSRNVRYLKSNFSMPTAGIANFTRALMAGFELLQAYNRTNDLGSQCNQAIMLITDGAISSHEDVFNRYNYPGAPIRVFTYMIGREVGDIRPTKRMACRNRGYYAHVINLSEVREQVQKYLPVMARPLVLTQHHPITWTNAYGDETHQVLTDWVLEIKRRERARLILNEELKRLSEASSSDDIETELTGIGEYDELAQVDEILKNRIICEDPLDEALDKSLQDEIDPLGYNDLACHWSVRRADLLTSVVKPVFDLRNTSIFFERILSKNVWQEREIRLRNAQLLGVASVDLRIADIIRAAPSHLLGPNGYPILLGQNGFIMHHPNFHALLEDPFDKQSKILKPYFNSLDLTHIEQVYHKNFSDLAKRSADEMKLLKLREASIKRTTGSESMLVKRTVDCRRRPHIRLQTFYYAPIRDTPYAFMLALPDSYGLNRVSAKMALDRDSYSYLQPSKYDLWTVHPEYRYCERAGGGGGGSGRGANSWQNVVAHQVDSSTGSGQQQQQQQQLHLNDSLSTLIELLNATAQNEAYELEYDDLSQIGGPTTSGGNSNNNNNNDMLFNANNNSNRQRGFLASSTQQQQQQQQPARYVCDKDLFGSLLFDAKATYESFVSTSSNRAPPPPSDGDGSCAQTSEEMRTKLAQIYGLEMSFVATRSGLTRTLVFDESPRIKKLAQLFIERHDRALDEAWYSRTVDWNMRFNDEATILSVPYNAYIRLVAKLRQRITQRHPAVNDTRANCDPTLVEDSKAKDDLGVQEGSGELPPPAPNANETGGGGGSGGGGESGAPSQTAGADSVSQSQMSTTIESSSGIIEIKNTNVPLSLADDGTISSGVGGVGGGVSDQIQNDDPQATLVKSSGGSDTVVEAITQLNGEQQDQQAATSEDQTLINVVSSTAAAAAAAAAASDTSDASQPVVAEVPEINYNEYSSFELLDLLANSSVHIAATQSVIVNKSKKQHRTPVAVTGHLYDYATFARKFLNSTSLNIKTYSDTSRLQQQQQEQQQLPPIKVDICPNGECPSQCGMRNDSIDCLLVDNNGYIIVGEELAHIGRLLSDYDERLMQSLVDKKVFHQVIVTDYQAICQDLRLNASTSQQPASSQQTTTTTTTTTTTPNAPGTAVAASLVSSSSSSSSSASSLIGAGIMPKPLQSVSMAQTVLANFASALVWTVATLYSALFLQSARLGPDELFDRESLLGRLHQWQRSAIMMAEAQSAAANQSLLAQLPNKTFLRPCERPIVLYETRPHDPAKVYDDSPEYYLTKCGCSAWRCEPFAPLSTSLTPPLGDNTIPVTQAPVPVQPPAPAPVPVPPLGAPMDSTQLAVSSANVRSAVEDQVCLMLERDAQLYVQKSSSCLAYHPEEASIHICGAGSRATPWLSALKQALISIIVSLALALLSLSSTSNFKTNSSK